MKLFTKTGATKIKRSNKGFTLIEVIIVIVLIGGLMAFLVPRLMSTGKENSSKNGANSVIEDMRQINEAAQMYATNKSAEITATADLAGKLVAQNLISSIPVPGAAYLDPVYATPANYVYNVDNATNYVGTAAVDTSLKVIGVTKEVCIKINNNFGVNLLDTDPLAAATAGKDPQCFGAGGVAGYTVVKVIHPH